MPEAVMDKMAVLTQPLHSIVIQSPGINSVRSITMNKIDAHHHFIPPFYKEALEKLSEAPSGWKIPDWTLQADRDFNKKPFVISMVPFHR